MTEHTDPDLLTIRRGLRLLRDMNPEAFAHHARGLALLLKCPVKPASPLEPEARRIAAQLDRQYPFTGFGEMGR